MSYCAKLRCNINTSHHRGTHISLRFDRNLILVNKMKQNKCAIFLSLRFADFRPVFRVFVSNTDNLHK